MYQPINGWTKARILQVINERPHDSVSISGDGERCVYLAPNGNKCAVGLFIPDGHPAQYAKATAGLLLDTYPDLASCMPLDVGGLMNFQNSHDSAIHFELFEGNAKASMIAWVEEHVTD